jgi:hypothetical protein
VESASDEFGGLGPVLGAMLQRDRLDTMDRMFWLDLWRAPILEAVEEMGIETRLYGPVLVFAVADLPRAPLLNVLHGAGEPGAVRHGYLAEALDWIERLGVDCRVPVGSDDAGAAAAEDLLNRRGYRRAGCVARFHREAAKPPPPMPPGIEIDEVDEFLEGFSDHSSEAFELPELDTFVANLPERTMWRSYVALDEQELPLGTATMMLHYENAAQLAFAATREAARGRGSHMALLCRRIRDAAEAGSNEIFADTEEPLHDPEGPSPAARNLVRAGFKQIAARTVWRPPPGNVAEEGPRFEPGSPFGPGPPFAE